MHMEIKSINSHKTTNDLVKYTTDLKLNIGQQIHSFIIDI